ncbi:MAG: dihydrolipoyl dehydrogenase family protein [Mycobacteriales bacterium]
MPVEADLVVVGGGAAGMAAARTAVRTGATVALVQDGPVGGDCTFTGCVPSKTLIESAAGGEGFAAAMARVHATVGRIAETETADVLRREGITVLEGRARIRSGRRVEVAGTTVEAGRLVIATGARPALPPIKGLAGGPFLTSETVWGLSRAPTSLLVLGGGAIGCELAQAFRQFGVRVTVVEGADRLLGKEEPAASEVITGVFQRDGIELRLGATAVRVNHSAPDTIRVELDDGSAIEAEQLLVAVGRTPVTEGLGLESAGVGVDERGFVRTDERMATSARGVFAAGDVTGRLPFTHAADEMGRIAAGNALRRLARQRFHAEWTPWVHLHPSRGGPGRADRGRSRRPRRAGRVPADGRGRPGDRGR